VTWRSLKPVFLSKWMLSPHRENAPRSQCQGCQGGGQINGLDCRDCSGRGWFDAEHPQRTGKAAAADDDAY
jgi:DnaJ-class molecular chaperone